MEDTKEVLNEVLVNLFNQIMFNEEKNLMKELDSELTIRDIHVLEAIYKYQIKKTASNIIAKALNVTAGTLTAAVKRLVGKGYVKRNVDGVDKRVVRLVLTKKGEKANTVHKKYHTKMVNTIVKDLSIEEEKLLVKLLDKVKIYFS